MPLDRNVQTIYLGPFPDVEKVHFANFFTNVGLTAGDLGKHFEDTTASSVGVKSYQVVQVDSGATSATPVGALAQGQTLYWKDKANYIVTNDSRFSIYGSQLGVAVGTVSNKAACGNYRNPSSGIFAALPGEVIFMQTRGRAVNVQVSTSPAIGDDANTGILNDAKLLNVAAGATASVNPVVGIFASAAVAGLATVDLHFPIEP